MDADATKTGSAARMEIDNLERELREARAMRRPHINWETLIVIILLAGFNILTTYQLGVMERSRNRWRDTAIEQTVKETERLTGIHVERDCTNVK